MEGKTLNLTGKGVDGRDLSLAAFKGKVVLVAYWATWCVPCREDLPLIRALYQEYGRRGFEIVGINLDSDLSAVGPYMKKNQITWPSFSENEGTRRTAGRSVRHCVRANDVPDRQERQGRQSQHLDSGPEIGTARAVEVVGIADLNRTRRVQS